MSAEHQRKHVSSKPNLIAKVTENRIITVMTEEKSNKEHAKEKKSNKKKEEFKGTTCCCYRNTANSSSTKYPNTPPTRVLNYSENDFPLLGCPRTSTKNRESTEKYNNEESRVTKITQTDSNSRMFNKKVLKSQKHKEAITIKLEDIVTKVNEKQQHQHYKTRIVKQITNEKVPGGNPLDSDNPVRQKGIAALKPKPKRISKTKATVYNAREETKRLIDLAKNIFVENNRIYYDDTCADELQKSLYAGKCKEIREALRCQSKGEDEVNNTEALSEEDSAKNVIPLQTVLREFTEPPYKILVHNSNFKRYCDACLSPELNEATEKLISQLVRYQYNKYKVDPIKAVAKKRYVLGLRQVKKYTIMNKIKLIVLVPNMEDSLCDIIEELKTLANAYCIPYLFGFSRRKLGQLAYKKVGVCCFGVLDYSGAEEHLKKCLEAASKAKKLYKEKCEQAKKYYEEYFTNQNNLSELSLPEKNETIIKNFGSKLSLCKDIISNSTKTGKNHGICDKIETEAL